MEERRYLWKIIRPSSDGHGVDVIGFVRMQPPSVLAGQVVPSFIDAFASAELARTEYPDAQDATASQPHCAVNVQHPHKDEHRP